MKARILRRSTCKPVGHVIVEDGIDVFICYKREDNLFSYYKPYGTVVDWIRDRHYKPLPTEGPTGWPMRAGLFFVPEF